MELITSSEEETQKEAAKLAKKTPKGAVLALYGDLGAGKTTFAQGFAIGLGIQERIISPTFILIRPYPLKEGQFHHIDLYRINEEKEAKGLGIEEILKDPNSITLIEWAQKIESLLPEKTVKIYFERIDENKRRIEIL